MAPAPTTAEDALTDDEVRAEARHPEVAAALAEIREADADATSIEQRIVAGDDEVGLDDLEEAERRGRFARLRARRAASKARRDREATREQALAEVRARVDGLFESSDLLDAYEAAVDAIANLLTTTVAHNETVRTAFVDLRKLGAAKSGDPVHVKGVPVTTVDIKQLGPAATSEAAKRALPHGPAGAAVLDNMAAEAEVAAHRRTVEKIAAAS
ncbi:MAG TPA: hypothetical protein VFU19_11450 [Iamia sp.]|nr:hypothetical protein [Iamia sp.]